ncbi:DUF6221 family protein [Paenarthrobacter sp. JL.01a]|uniref:DUF6221 family protein n=1 Tax=Paenarthrobacter sp. JL.01a TaxID=2979324 RepID=UPI0021C94E7B|nr:DUF6221 family protein [Paenarthrobacter sp. JL.01a]UXM92517.1 DUF6221 family protein [Paenarthrobacter sp. JL.01a]
MTITEFLQARIAEDEALATKAARGSDGEWHRGHGWMPDEDECRVEGDSIVIYDEGGHDPNQAEHIARHDPARVLAECAAKRAIIELHRRLFAAPHSICNRCTDYTTGDADDYPCDTLCALATIYKDHPDYQQEWAA